MATQARAKNRTREKILDAAGVVLIERGYSNVSTRLVAKTAGVPLSQIHYHFKSKHGLILGLFEYRNEQLLERQNKMFSDESLSISDQWALACEYFDQDIDSGYVRTLMELCAAGWSDPEIAEIVQETFLAWQSLIAGVAERAEVRFGTLGPFSPKTISALVGSAFIGAEAFLLLNVKTQAIPVRRALDEFGELLRAFEAAQT